MVTNKTDYRVKRIALIIFVAWIVLVVIGLWVFRFGLGKAIYDYISMLGPTESKNLNDVQIMQFRLRLYTHLFGLSTFFALLGCCLAKYKKLNIIMWSVICFFTNVIGLILLLIVPTKRKYQI